jgi:lysophospholipase L1-like esterase
VGTGDPAALGWVGRLAQEAPADVALTTYNLGVRGDTAAQVVARFGSELPLRLRAGAENKVVVSFGVNDVLQEDDTAATGACLQALVEDTVRRELPLLVVGPPPLVDDDLTARIADLSAELAEVCRRSAVPFVEVCAPLSRSADWMEGARLGDGAHPAEAGYRALAGLVRPAWARFLEPQGA